MAKHVTSPLWGLDSIWTMNPESPVHGLNERLHRTQHCSSSGSGPVDEGVRALLIQVAADARPDEELADLAPEALAVGNDRTQVDVVCHPR